MSRPNKLGGVIHTYQKFDPVHFPSPHEAPNADLLSHAFDHLLAYGDMRELTEEELARAIRLDASMIPQLGPSIDALKAILEERKRKILSTYETSRVLKEAKSRYEHATRDVKPPKKWQKVWKELIDQEQIYDWERAWNHVDGNDQELARGLMKIIDRLGDKYQVDELDAKYDFVGKQSMTIPEAIAIKEELEKIDELLKQLEDAKETAQIGIIDMESLKEFTEPGDLDELSALGQQVQDILKELAERQGLERSSRGFELTPKAYRLFQSKLLQQIFAQLQAGKTGRHEIGIVGEGTVESQRTKPYEFGDSIVHMDIPGTMINAMIRQPNERPIRLRSEDIEIHRTKNHPKCATVVVMDMSGSMGYDGLYFNVKRMALALEGLIRSEYPGDYLQFIEMATFAKPRHASEVVKLMPKPVTVFSPVVRLKADLSDPQVSESMIHPHFTNIQHALSMSRKFLANQDTPNKQIFLITDGLPTAHFEQSVLYLLYPADPRTEEATMREGALCARDGIVINLFLLSTWNQTREDIHFAHRLAEQTKGRVFFTAGKDLERFVVWDYVSHKKQIIG
ncbi:hypothetical protein K2X85_00425 [bacterium]|nr:hypothetical protein [bacterium]